MEKEKMVRTAKALDTVFRILKIIVIICAIVGVAVLGIVTVVDLISSDSVIVMVDIGPFTFKLAEEAAPDNGAVLIYVWLMMAAAVAVIAVVCYAIGIIRKILAPMTEGNPFDPTVGKDIRRLAFACLAIGLIKNIMSAAEVFCALNIYDLNALLQNSRIQSVTAAFRCDLSYVAVFFVLLLMSHIFHYGAELQRLSDETL